MKQEIMHLPNSELELMLIIWEADGPVTRPELEAKLSEPNKWGPTTILKFLSRLVEKGFLSCESAGRRQPNRYTALISEEQYLKEESSSVLGRLCGRSVTSLVANLYQNNTIDDEELDELQEFLNEARGGKKK